mmetsp:Transcript_29306/g.73023  ORF Transcript_29306/g.73023 Transcript_29306/m.73023 type:complete len:212 (+) Transcript_29306:338-973(+)
MAVPPMACWMLLSSSSSDRLRSISARSGRPSDGLPRPLPSLSLSSLMGTSLSSRVRSTSWSSVKRRVTTAPMTATLAHMMSRGPRPRACCRGVKATVPITAPILPDAADRPWQVARMRVGYTSAGMMKVVVLGPKLLNRKVPPNRISSRDRIPPPAICSMPRRAKNTPMATKPHSCSRRLPIWSMKHTLKRYPGMAIRATSTPNDASAIIA